MELLTLIKGLAESEQMQVMAQSIQNQQQEIDQLSRQVEAMDGSTGPLIGLGLMIVVTWSLLMWHGFQMGELKKRLNKLVPLIEKAAGITLIEI